MTNGKVAFVISPQAWGNMRITKHHYAIELAKLGYTTYYFNPPLLTLGLPKLGLTKDPSHENLIIANPTLFGIFPLKFHIFWLYSLMVRWQLLLLTRKIEKPDLIL